MNLNIGIKHSFILYFLFFQSIRNVLSIFIPNRTDYDAYGVKIAINENLLVLAENKYNPPEFFIQFAPYSQINISTQCLTSDPSMLDVFIYSVVIGKKQSTNEMHFYFSGELTNNKTGLLVGLAVYNITQRTFDFNRNSSLICNTSFVYQTKYFFQYGHQEYYRLGVEPYGRYTYGFSNEFIFIFDSRNTSHLDIWNGALTWPDATFIPLVVDISETFGVVSGFTFNGINSTVKYSPMIYLFNFNSTNKHPFVVFQYKPIATPATWQDLLTNADANVYSPKYDMSVSINEFGDVLVGMQFINRVFLFSVNLTSPTELNFVSRHTNGRTLGNGKNIAWLENGIAALIVNVYTLEYQWTSSQVHIYGIVAEGYNSNSTPLSVFPNNHQKLPKLLNSIFLNIVSSPSALALLDIAGGILIFLPTAAGYYLTVKTSDTMPLITEAQQCEPGTFKNQSGVHDCTLCPTGTRNPGNFTTGCIPCSLDTFCPLGSVNEVPQTALKTLLQAIPYPKSPDSVIFDEILIQNMFSIGPGRCLLVSPLFWTLIAAAIAVTIIAIMGILKYCTKNPQGKRVRKILKCFFQHTDLIGEGELWVGGLASFAIVVLVAFACIFSKDYIRQYPIETSNDSYFACDLSIRNAKFETSVQSLAIPLTDFDQHMFTLLDNQEFILNVDFVNTLIKCDAVSIEALFGLTWSTIRWLDCDNINYTLSLSIPLPYQQLSVQIYVEDIKTIGAIRIGLFGVGHQYEKYTLKELNFYQAFYKNGYILSRNVPVGLTLTKVVNETLAIDGSDSLFGGLYVPTFTVDYNSLFSTGDQFVRSTITLTTLALTITETPYYVKNLQQPIAKPSEIIFQSLLFMTVCLELFGLIFLSYKLLFKPFYYRFLKKNRTLSGNRIMPTDDYLSKEKTHEQAIVNLPDQSRF